jgi:flagellar L-ring protein precursor FlgH
MKAGFMTLLLSSIGLLSAMKVVDATTLYKAESFQALTSDTRSYRVGDALTVLIVETSSASSEADSTNSRDLSLAGSANGVVHQNLLDAELKRSITATGQTNRMGSLQAQISARVQSVAANGDLFVQGKQQITVNSETQTISVAGIVRPIDISSDNIVLSTRLTDADITYSGRGFVDRSQQEGLISRILSWIGL